MKNGSIENGRFKNIKFFDQLLGVDIDSSSFYDCDFQDCDFTKTRFSESIFIACYFKGCRFSGEGGAEFSGCTFDMVSCTFYGEVI